MSDHIAHLGICDDSFRLAQLHPAVHVEFKRLMRERRDEAHMGSITRSADKWSVDLVGWASRELRKQSSERGRNADAKLAFTLGTLTHRAADRLTKPITNCWRGSPDSGRAGDAANESKIYQDVFVFKEVFASGLSPDAAGLFDATIFDLRPAEAAGGAEALYRILLRRALIAMHTLNPDKGQIHDWLDRFFEGMQTFPKSLEQYAAIHRDWDAASVDKYLTTKRFYERDDPLIRLARRIQAGALPPKHELISAHQLTNTEHSRYARALAKAVDYLIAATEFFDGKIDATRAAARFDIGVPELSLQE